MNNMRLHCQRQYAAAFLNQVWNELEPRTTQGPQLLQNKEPRDSNQVIFSGYIMQYVENKKKWKERYFVMKADYSLECFESNEAAQRGLKPDMTVHLSGCILLSSVSDYREMLNQSWTVFNGVVDTYLEEQHLGFPTSQHLFLWHSYRPHLLLCFHTEDNCHTWSVLFADGIRHLNTVLFGRDSFDVRAFLEAVRVYREQKGRYGICDLYLGSETEILSNLVMEDLCPVLESQLIPHIRGAEIKRKQTWLKMLGEMYAVVESHVSEKFQTLLMENEEQKQRLERTIRPDFNQILTTKKQIMEKIRASLEGRVRCSCQEHVQPQLGSVQEAVAGSMKTLLAETRRLFSEEVSEVIDKVKSAGDGSSLAEVCSQILVSLRHAAQMHHCYKKTEELERYLSEVGPRFTFCGAHFLMQRAQHITHQLMEDAVYTFQQMLTSMQPAAGLPAESGHHLDKTRVLVLKKLDSDSNAAGRQFVRDVLLELVLPFVLKTLEPSCKPELPVYEAFMSVDDDGLIQIESIFKELVLHIVTEEINKVMKETSTQPKFSLYNESMAYLWDNEPQLPVAEIPTCSTSPTELAEQASALETIKECEEETRCLPDLRKSKTADGM
ncbi:protein Niban 1-like [Narcine bancroftii]|uniref:protein Niban 1-like n=1 Tax=Narcine bancroftii TaxID=1343680 RepID=UPI00383171E1